MAVDVNGIIQDQAQQSGVDPSLALAIILHGENSPQNSTSPKGAHGFAQLMPGTARDLGVDVNDPEQNLRGGVRYIRQLQDTLGTKDAGIIAAGYNAGPGAVQSHGGIPDYPETQAYVQRVKAAMPQNQPFADSDFDSDSKSGATQTQNSSAIAPKFADSDFEAAAPVKPASGAELKTQTGDSAKSLLDRVTLALLPTREAPQQTVGGLVAGTQPTQKNLNGQDVSGTLMSPVLGSALRGLALPDTLIATPLTRMLGRVTNNTIGNANEPSFADYINAHTAAPTDPIENTIGKPVQFASGALGGSLAMKAIGAPLAASGLPYVGALGRFMSSAGQINPGTVPGAIAGGYTAEGIDKAGKAMDVNPYVTGAASTLGGALAGGPIAGAANRMMNGISPEIAATLNAARSANVPVQLSDVNPNWAAAARLADKMPFGLGNLFSKGVPAKQVAGVRDALADAAEQYRPAGLDATSGAQGTDRFLANDLRTVAGQRQAQANDLYKAVDDIAGNAELPAASLPQTTQTASELWERFPDAFKGLELDAKTKGILNALKPGQAAEEAPQMVNVGGVKMNWATMDPRMKAALAAQGIAPEEAAGAAPLTFQNLNDLRTGLGDVLGQAKQAALSGTQSRTKVGILSQMYKAVTDDIDGYMNSPGVPAQLKTAATAAQDFFKNNILPLRSDSRINQVLAHPPGADGADTAAEGLHQYLFSANKGETAQKYLGMLSPAGQQAAAYQAIKSATDSALNTATETGIKSATGIGKLANSPALDAVASANPGMSQDIARIQALMRLGRTAATTEAGKGALTGFQTRDLGALYGINEAAQAAMHHGLSGGAAYGLAAGVPLSLSNVVSLLNSRSPAFLRNYLMANGGTAGQRYVPGALAAQTEGQ